MLETYVTPFGMVKTMSNILLHKKCYNTSATNYFQRNESFLVILGPKNDPGVE